MQTFLNFTNFYRRFIKNFSCIIKSLVNLTKKERFFVWKNVCQKIFEKLKRRIIETSILFYFSIELKTFLESNSFNYVSVEILSQRKDNDLIKSVTYFLKILFLVECNYDIYYKKLLIIIHCFKKWETELQSIKSSSKVFTDHKYWKYFMITKKLNRCQIK